MRSKQAPIYPPSSPTVSPCRGQTGSSQSHRCRPHCRKQQSRCWRCRCSSWRPCPRGHNAPPRYSPAGGERGQRGGHQLRIACCMLCGVCMACNQPQLPCSRGCPAAMASLLPPTSSMQAAARPCAAGWGPGRPAHSPRSSLPVRLCSAGRPGTCPGLPQAHQRTRWRSRRCSPRSSGRPACRPGMGREGAELVEA